MEIIALAAGVAAGWWTRSNWPRVRAWLDEQAR